MNFLFEKMEKKVYNKLNIINRFMFCAEADQGGSQMVLKKAGIITRIVLLILVVYAAVTLIGLRSRIKDAEIAVAARAAEVDQVTRDNEILSYEIAHSSDPETYENVARSKLGLVKPGEEVFYDVSGR